MALFRPGRAQKCDMGHGQLQGVCWWCCSDFFCFASPRFGAFGTFFAASRGFYVGLCGCFRGGLLCVFMWVTLLEEASCAANPPLWADSEMQQPILGLYTAPPRLELVVWACLGPSWPSLPAEPCDPPSVGHFSLASKGTERGPHRPACGMRETKRYSTMDP